MNYDKEILSRAKSELEKNKILREAACEEEKRRVYSLLPRVEEIDSELRGTVFDIIRASFGEKGDREDLLSKTKEKNIRLQAEREKILSAAGIPFDFAEVKYSCDSCNDSGFCGGEPCTCLIALCRKEQAREINRSLSVSDVAFSDFDLTLYPDDGAPSARAHMREVFEFCRDFARDFDGNGESLFMTGDTGLGKTFLSSCIAKEVSEHGFSVISDTAFSLLGTLEDIKFSRSDEDPEIFKNADLLIIDDIGCEMTTPFSQAALFELINSRMNKGKATVAITTLSDDELSKRYSKQLISRLEGSFIKLQFLGCDVRLMR